MSNAKETYEDAFLRFAHANFARAKYTLASAIDEVKQLEFPNFNIRVTMVLEMFHKEDYLVLAAMSSVGNDVTPQKLRDLADELERADKQSTARETLN